LGTAAQHTVLATTLSAETAVAAFAGTLLTEPCQQGRSRFPVARSVRAPHTERPMANPISWFEVLGSNPDKLRGFYGRLFDWKFQPLPDPTLDYAVIDKAQTGIGGGVGKAPQ